MKSSIALRKAIPFTLLVVMILSFVMPQSVYAEEALPDQEPAPAQESAPGGEADPSEEPAPAQEPAPGGEADPSEEPAPAQEPAPDGEADPSEEPVPDQEPAPDGEAIPSKEPAPAQEPAPDGEAIPSKEPAPAQEPVPAGEPAPVLESDPSEKPFMAQDSAPAAESDSIGGFTPDLGSHTIVQNDGIGYYSVEADPDGVGQSFRAPFSGLLTKIGTVVNAATSGIIMIFSGETAVGDPLHAQEFAFDAGVNEITLNDQVSVAASQLYTFALFFGTTTSIMWQDFGNSYTDGKLIQTDGTESVSSDSEDLTFYVDIARKKTSNQSSGGTEENNPPANRVIVPVDSGQQEAIRCHVASTLLLLPNDNSAEFSGLCGCDASLNSLQNSGLPGVLPAGVVFSDGMTTNLISAGTPVDLVPGGSVTVRFALPGALTDKTLVLMLWDEGAGTWVEIPLSGSESSFSSSNSLMKVLKGVTIYDGAVQVTVNFMGSFVLAAK